MDWKLALQLAGVVLGLLYLWLEYRADIRLWIVGLVMPLVHGTLYYKSGLYADCAMQVYYILAGLYGLCVWAKKPKPAERETGRIARTPARMWFRMAAAYAAIHALLYVSRTAPFRFGTASPRRSASWPTGCFRANTSSNGSCGWPWTS